MRCGDACFSNDRRTGFVCHDNQYVCPALIPERCGMSCYERNSFRCINGELHQRLP